MNFESQLFNNSSNVNYSSNGQMSPLSIMPVNQSSSSNMMMWSPFSAPSLSPYGVSHTNFQFSSSFSPSQNYSSFSNGAYSRPIGKPSLHKNNESNVLRELSLNQNATAFSPSSFGQLNRFNNQIENRENGYNRFETKPSTSVWSNVYNQNQMMASQTIQRPTQRNTNETRFSNNNNVERQQPQIQQQQQQQVNDIQFAANGITKLPKRSQQIDMSEFINKAAEQRKTGGRIKLCTFCKTNGENEEIYTSHSLKDSTDRITCPILMLYSCPVCGASGEATHTKKYCPVLQKKLRMDMLKKMQQTSSNDE